MYHFLCCAILSCMSCIVVFLVEIVSFLTCTVGKISVLKKQS